MKVKICGLTNYADAALALELGADIIGFVLASSPRRIAPAEVARVLSRLRAEGLLAERESVGVFVNEPPEAMAAALAEAGLDSAQVHGDESPADCAALPFPWYRALRIASAGEAARAVSAGWACGRILVDSAVAGAAGGQAYGGTGVRVGIEAALAARDAARAVGKEFILAGGIMPHNVFEALISVAPDGIDLSSGVEESPGKKSRDKLETLFAEIRRAREEMKDE